MTPPTLSEHFPNLAKRLASSPTAPFDEVGEPATTKEIERIERLTGVPFPDSYKHFLECARDLAIGDGLRMSLGEAFFHESGISKGMLCFADFWLEGDGDQALFDVSNGLVDGEYPVYYYNHETPNLRKLADGFREFIEQVVAVD